MEYPKSPNATKVAVLHPVHGESFAWRYQQREGMVLECRCPWDGNLSLVSWTKSPNATKVAVLHPVHGESFAWRYQQRVEFPRATPMDGSMVLRNVTHQDLGLYHCSITTFPRGSWSRDVRVEDQDEPPEDDDDDNNNKGDAILIPAPGQEAHIHVDAISGEAIVFPCNHDDDDNDDDETSTKTTTPVWQKVVAEWYLQGDTWSTVASRTAAEEEEVDEEEEDRISCTQRLSVCTVRLHAVTPKDAGFYRCRFIGDAGEGQRSSRTVRLTVHEPGVAGLVLLLSLVLVLLVCYRKRVRRVRLQSRPLETNHHHHHHHHHHNTDRQKTIARENPMKKNRRAEYNVKQNDTQRADRSHARRAPRVPPTQQGAPPRKTDHCESLTAGDRQQRKMQENPVEACC
ncbi:hypothetical protein CRUP_032117 [Coryphaenoides rupestris]|nr:hypothetical protein CRUP_032117 [Coryphaenoides rupestris]